MSIPEVFSWHLESLQRTLGPHVTRGHLTPPERVWLLGVIPRGHPPGHLLVSIVTGQGHFLSGKAL